MARKTGTTYLAIAGILGLALGLGLVALVTFHSTPAVPPTTILTVHQPVYEFFASKSGVQCEILTDFSDGGPVAMNGITCYTNSPPRRVSLDDVGKVTQCRGMNCLANPGMGTPVLAANTRVFSGPHSCLVTADGVKCGNASSVTVTMTTEGSSVTGQHPVVLNVTVPIFEFYGPTRSTGIECEINVPKTGADVAQTLCISVTPPQRAVLVEDGTFTTCNGEDCLSNAGLGTMTLVPNTNVHSGPFTCIAGRITMRCTSRNRGGFELSASGIRAIH
ncbi:MAG: hypothetical protein WCL38_02095 [Actinomycetota bacterium]